MNAITPISSPACKGCDETADADCGGFCSADCLTLHYLNADFPIVVSIWPPVGASICETCGGGGGHTREWHRVRGCWVHGYCDDCDGRGHTKPHTLT